MAVTTAYSLADVVPQFTANTFATGEQTLSSIIALGSGGYAVAYASDAAGGDFPSVQFYSSVGDLTPVRRNPFTGATADMIGQPVLTELSNGNVAVVWKEGAGAGNMLLATIYNPVTGLVAGTKEIVISAGADASEPQVAALANGNWAVVSTDTASGLSHLHIMGPDGQLIRGDVALEGAGGQSNPSITALDNGRMAIAYRDTLTEAIVVSLYLENGNRVPRPAIAVASTVTAESAKIAALSSGGFAVVYDDSSFNGTPGIGLKLFTAGGTDVTPGGTIRVDVDFANEEFDPGITVLENGFIIVSWAHQYEVGDSDIYARVFDSSGNAILVDGSALVVLDNSQFNETQASLAAFFGGVFGTVWSDSEGDGSGGAIAGRIAELTRTTIGDGGDNTLDGDVLQDDMNGGNGTDVLNGAGGNDILSGGEGDDTLNGGDGRDNLSGGNGNDIYVIGNSGDTQADIIAEALGGGNDTVRVNRDFRLGTNAEIEELLALSAGSTNALALTGNKFNQSITGNLGSNVLRGLGGDDRLDGGGQGAEADVLVGGTGDDIYVIRGGEVIVELAGAGNDSILLDGGTYELAGGVSVETVSALDSSGTAGLSFTGNELAQNVTGDAGADVLSGGGGDDFLDGGEGLDSFLGGTGDDSFVIGDAAESVSELAGEGSDIIITSVSYSLDLFAVATSEIETIMTSDAAGTSAIALTGNAYAQAITGNAGNNVLSGLAGSDELAGFAGADKLIGGRDGDTLSGGAGNDAFVYNSRLEGGDSIADFSSAAAGNNDRFEFRGAAFGGLAAGALAASLFQASTADSANTANVRFLFETDTGILRYDADGSGAGAAIIMATLQAGAVMGAGDIVII